jgi:MoaA/NifB/PqqE/SkfB family radical SAM enzyme
MECTVQEGELIKDGFEQCQIPAYRIVQVHPTLRCNLKCAHCYSSSLPAYHDFIPVKALTRFLDFARGQGFNVVSMSGGEPFLYPDLGQLLGTTQQMGYKNSVATNAMLLAAEAKKQWLNYIDIIAISVDGPPDIHNSIRQQHNAFEKMLIGLEAVKAAKENYGFIHTITNRTGEYLLWLVEFALQHGAKLLQLHPLELSGRATVEMGHMMPDQELLEKIYLTSFLLKEDLGDQLFIQLDSFHHDFIVGFPELIYAGKQKEPSSINLLSECFREIVITEVGDILPIGYGMHPSYKIGSIFEECYEDMLADYFKNVYPRTQQLFLDVYQGITQSDDVMVNWNSILHSFSHRKNSIRQNHNQLEVVP